VTNPEELIVRNAIATDEARELFDQMLSRVLPELPEGWLLYSIDYHGGGKKGAPNPFRWAANARALDPYREVEGKGDTIRIALLAVLAKIEGLGCKNCDGKGVIEREGEANILCSECEGSGITP
jgi:hypothetical protein